jgi:hypothetical protein
MDTTILEEKVREFPFLEEIFKRYCDNFQRDKNLDDMFDDQQELDNELIDSIEYKNDYDNVYVLDTKPVVDSAYIMSLSDFDKQDAYLIIEDDGSIIRPEYCDIDKAGSNVPTLRKQIRQENYSPNYIVFLNREENPEILKIVIYKV